MSPSGISFLIGYVCIFAAERMFGGNDMVRYALLGTGALLNAAALALRAMTLGKHPAATKAALGFYAVSIFSLVVYAVGGKDMIEGLGLSTESAGQVQSTGSESDPDLLRG